MDLDYYDLLLEAGILINKAETEEGIIKIIVEYANNAMKSDLVCFYLNEKKLASSMKLNIKKGFNRVPEVLQKQSELLNFLSESRKLVCLNSRKQSPFEGLLLSDSMESGLGILISIGQTEYGVLIVNSKRPYFFKRKEISFLENLSSIIISKNLNRRLK